MPPPGVHAWQAVALSGPVPHLLHLVTPEAGSTVVVRLSPLSLGRAETEFDAALAVRPDLVVLQGVVGLRDVEQLGAKLAVREAEMGFAPGSVRMLAVATDSAAGLLALPNFDAGRLPRLAALVHDPDSLRRSLGCEPDAAVLWHAAAVTVIAASAAGVPAYIVARGVPDIRAICVSARREGFTGALIDDAASVPVAADAFSQRLPA